MKYCQEKIAGYEDSIYSKMPFFVENICLIYKWEDILINVYLQILGIVVFFFLLITINIFFNTCTYTFLLQ